MEVGAIEFDDVPRSGPAQVGLLTGDRVVDPRDGKAGGVQQLEGMGLGVRPSAGDRQAGVAVGERDEPGGAVAGSGAGEHDLDARARGRAQTQRFADGTVEDPVPEAPGQVRERALGRGDRQAVQRGRVAAATSP